VLAEVAPLVLGQLDKVEFAELFQKLAGTGPGLSDGLDFKFVPLDLAHGVACPCDCQAVGIVANPDRAMTVGWRKAKSSGHAGADAADAVDGAGWQGHGRYAITAAMISAATCGTIALP